MNIPIGNTHKRERFGPSPGRTEFQTAYVIEVSKRRDFDFFCGNPMCDEVYRGPTTVLYFTKDRRLHADRLGQKKVLHTAVSAGFILNAPERNNR